MWRRGGARLGPDPDRNYPVQIEIIPCLSDNYAYLIKQGEHCAVLDPSEAAPVQAALNRSGWSRNSFSIPIITMTMWAAIWR